VASLQGTEGRVKETFKLNHFGDVDQG
jgi:hypothetical protein